MKTYIEPINWKGIGDYLSAARTLTEHGSTNVAGGPVIHCQGLAVELALKFYLWDQRGEYPGTHNLDDLALKCAIPFKAEELAFISNLTKQYLQDAGYPYPSRYRPNALRVVVSPGQAAVEAIVSKVMRASSQAHLLDRILSR